MSRARSAYADGGLRRNVEFIEKAPVSTNHFHDQFDFVVANGRAVQLAQAWSFQLPDQDELIRDIKAWAWTVLDIRREGGSVTQLPREVTIPHDVDVAAIYIPPVTDGGHEILQVATALCHDTGIRLVPVGNIVAELVRPALEMLATPHR